MHINIDFILENKRDETVTINAIKTYGRSGYIAPLIFKVGTLLHSPLPLTLGQGLPVRTNYEVGYAQELD
jgi:hypothetical protein